MNEELEQGPPVEQISWYFWELPGGPWLLMECMTCRALVRVGGSADHLTWHRAQRHQVRCER